MDAVEIVGGVSVFAVNTYLAYKANQIFAEQNRIMREQLAHDRGEAPVVTAESASRFRTYWPLLAMAALTVITWSAVGYDIYDRHKSGVPTRISDYEWGHYAFKTILNQSFANQTVVLDGYEYVNCTFENVTFVYDGTAPARMSSSHITLPKGGRVTLQSNNGVVVQTMTIMGGLNLVSGGPLTSIPNVNPFTLTPNINP